MYPHPHAVPSWHIEVLSNATWQWHAPTAPEERRIRSRQVSIPSLWGKFLKWLEMSDADKPFILPPKDIDDYPSFSKTIQDLRLNISFLASTDANTVQNICQAYCVSIQEGILQGYISTEDMLVALDPFDSASRKVISDTGISGKIFSMIRSSIAEALEATQISGPDAVPDGMWTAMFKFVAAINDRFHDVSCFNKLMLAMPESAKASIPNNTLFIYIATFVQSQATRDHRNPAWRWCCAKIGTALAQLSEGQRLSIFTNMSHYIQNARCDADTRMKRSFAWLLIQAYDSCLNARSFTQIYNQSSGRRMDHNGYRIWQLAVARLYSNGALSKDAHRQIAGWNYHDGLSQRWTTTVKTLLATEHPEAAIASLCDFLTDIGETWHLIEGLILSHAEDPCAEVLRTVAETCGKLDIAIALRIAANDTKNGSHLLCAGLSGSSEEQFEKFMTYPKAESYTWRAIKAEGGTVESKMELIDFLSDMYSSRASLSRSQRIRRVRRATAYQMALTGKVSPTVLRNTVDAVTLDLDAGHSGRKTHLQWATKLVHDQVGSDVALKMQKQLEGWRHLIRNATPHANAARASVTEVQRSRSAETAGALDDRHTLEEDSKRERKPSLSNRFD
ncbi:hypothetical protein MY4038_008215 [Beauveria bassiana]